MTDEGAKWIARAVIAVALIGSALCMIMAGRIEHLWWVGVGFAFLLVTFDDD